MGSLGRNQDENVEPCQPKRILIKKSQGIELEQLKQSVPLNMTVNRCRAFQKLHLIKESFNEQSTSKNIKLGIIIMECITTAE